MSAAPRLDRGLTYPLLHTIGVVTPLVVSGQHLLQNQQHAGDQAFVLSAAKLTLEDTMAVTAQKQKKTNIHVLVMRVSERKHRVATLTRVVSRRRKAMVTAYSPLGCSIWTSRFPKLPAFIPSAL